MARLRPFLSIILAAFALSALACSSAAPTNPSTQVTPGPTIGKSQPVLTLAADGLVSGTAPLGVFRLTVEGLTGYIEPALRSGQLTGAKFETDLSAAMTGEILTRCPDCFRVLNVIPSGDNQVQVEISLKHPIPSPDGVAEPGAVTNRNDLHVNNVRLVAVVDGGTQMFADSGPEAVTVNMDSILNADGYTRLDPIVDISPVFEANVFPFITMGDDDPVNSGTGNFQPGIGDGAGWEDVLSGDPTQTDQYPKGFNVLPQGGEIIDFIEIDLTAGSFSTDLVVLGTYIGAADARPTRLTSRYFMPEGAIQQSPHVELSTSMVPGSMADDPGQLSVGAVDFQQGAEINSDPVSALETRDYSRVWADGRINDVTVTIGDFVGGVNTFLGGNPQPASLGRNAVAGAPGTGSYAAMKQLTFDFTNANAVRGDVRVGVKVTDSRDGAAMLDVVAAGADPLNPNVFSSITGLREDLNVFNPASVVAANELATYQFTTFTIGGIDPPEGGVVIPDTPGRANPNWENALYRNALVASGTNVYTCFNWGGNNDENLFVARSADGGENWGVPVQVPADGIANTLYEGRGFSMLVTADGLPALVGIDVEEDLVFLVGANNGTNSTSWPTGAAHRVEVEPQGANRIFDVSAVADPSDATKIHIGTNIRIVDPATSNEVRYFMVEGVGSATPTGRLVTEANGGIMDNGPDAGASRFDIDVAMGSNGVVHFLWKDGGDSALEYRTAMGATVSPISGPFAGKFLTGFVRPNIAVHPTTNEPYVVIDYDSATIASDGELDDRDVFVVMRSGNSWSTPLQVNTDDLDLDEKEAEIAMYDTGGGVYGVAVVYEADLGNNSRRIFLATVDAALTMGSLTQEQLTPDPGNGEDRLDPKVAGTANGLVVVWEAKREGDAGQSTTR